MIRTVTVLLCVFGILNGQDAAADLTAERITTPPQLDFATDATYAPGDFTRLFVIEREGRIRVINLKTGELNPIPFLAIEDDVTDWHEEQGMLGLTFHPNYQENGFFYVAFTNIDTEDGVDDTEIRRYTVSNNPDVAIAQSAVTIIEIEQQTYGHTGHWIDFSPTDGYLYISMGDGGIASSSQDLESLTGKMLRLDVDGVGKHGENYAIPPDNPFVDGPGADEIWFYGLRNPWGGAFDRETGDLYMSDVGGASKEELNVLPGGARAIGGLNFGWPCMEGTDCFDGGGCVCNDPSLTRPIFNYTHGGDRCAIIGGIIYRGCHLPDEVGNYFFADYCSNDIWSLQWDGDDSYSLLSLRSDELAPSDGHIDSITSFGEDAWGSMYIIEDGGEIWRMIDTDHPIRWADIDCDGTVTSADLLIVLFNWGDCVGCRADVNGDDVVDSQDLLAVLVNWG